MKTYRTKKQQRRPIQRRSKAPPDWPEDMPPPRMDEPPEPRPGATVGAILLDWYGRRYEIPLRVPGTTATRRRARSDQIAAEIGGQWLVMSLRAALLEVDRMVPRVLSRKERGAT